MCINTDAIHIWHEYRLRKQSPGWNKRSSFAVVTDLRGFGRVQQANMARVDPTQWAAVEDEVALSVDRVLREELDERGAQMLVLRIIGRQSMREVADHFGISRNTTYKHYDRAFSTLSDRVGHLQAAIHRRLVRDAQAG